MNQPPTWMDHRGTHRLMAGRNGAGCTGFSAPGEAEKAQGCAAEWYSNYTWIPGNATIPRGSPLLTYQDACMSGLGVPSCCAAPCTDPAMQAPGMPCAGCDWTLTHPWRAPGTAPVFSPCGIDGGNPHGCPAGNPFGDNCASGGYGHGPDGRTLPGNHKPEEWLAGSEVEVSWGLAANHGGGYQYRLCPKPAIHKELKEECFQQMPLRFVGDTQWLQRALTSKRVAIPAIRTDTGTFPAGSQWTRNPIPACGGFTGGNDVRDGTCAQVGTQFLPPAEGVFGFYQSPWNIIDKVQVPQLAPGEYVISFRYDAEQTTQVWQQCGDVRIVDSPPPPSPAPPSPCDECFYGACVPCQACIQSKDGACASCWAVNQTSGSACLYDDARGCQSCWSPQTAPIMWHGPETAVV